MKIYGDIPRFYIGRKPLYDIGNGLRVSRREAIAFIINNYGWYATAEAYNITSIKDEQDVFIFTFIQLDDVE